MTAGYKTAPSNGSNPLQLSDAASASWLKRVVDVVNNILQGKQNVVLVITLRANQATTTIIDSRIGPFSALILQPLTTHAQADYVSATGVLADQTTQKNGSVTFNHPNNANADKTFNLLIMG